MCVDVFWRSLNSAEELRVWLGGGRVRKERGKERSVAAELFLCRLRGFSHLQSPSPCLR